MGTASLTIKGWDISFDLSKPLRAQSESQILKLGCVRTRASKEAVARKDEGSEKQWDCELLEGVQSTRGYMARSFPGTILFFSILSLHTIF